MAVVITQKDIVRYCLLLAMIFLWMSPFFEIEASEIEGSETENAEFPQYITKSELQNKLVLLERFGVKIPTTLVSAVNRLNEVEQETAQHLNQWSTWLLEDPRKLGKIGYANEPLIAGTVANIEQRIQIGTRISTGGGFLIAKHWLHPIQFQFENKDQANFISATGSHSKVKFEIILEAIAGIHGGLDSKIELPFFRLIEGSLEEGDELLIKHKNLTLPETATDAFSLPVYFRETAESALTEFQNETLRVYGGVLNSVEVIVPTYVRPGIGFSAKLFLKDKFGNLAEGRMPSFDLTVDGELYQRVPAGSGNKHVIEGIELNYGTRRLIEVKSSGGGIRASSNPFRLINTRKKVLWGDPNASIELGEGISGSIKPQLDFSISAIHDEYLTKARWQSIQGQKSWVWGKDFLSGGFHQIISAWREQGIQSQTQLVTKMLSQDVLSIASAANPIDDRFLNNKQTRFVELVSNNAHFETQANVLLGKGYRMGFTGSNHSHLIPLGARVDAALTAVMVEDGEDWLTAFKRGSTYVTTGHRALLEFSVNNAQPGQRAVSDDIRVIEGRVEGTFGIHKIEIVKNGKVIYTDTVSRILTDEEQGQLKVSFRSESAPHKGQRDLPRNGREWIGFFRSDALISNVEAPGFVDTARQGIVQSQKNRIDFITWTRGTESSFMLGFETLAKDTVFELNLREAHEEIDVKPLTRPSSEIPAVRQLVSLFDLVEGPVKRQIRINGYSDEITFEFVNAQVTSSASFKFVDTSAARDGDYYYVRVQQLDDQMAWSSPVFVGGFDQP